LDYQDEVESRQLYEILEKEIVPLFYKRGDDKLPREWITMMKASMRKLGSFFNTNRMVEQYFKKFYFRAYDKRKNLITDDYKLAKEYTDWKGKVIKNWTNLKFVKIDGNANNNDIKVGNKYIIETTVHLVELSPEDIDVQIYYSSADKTAKEVSSSCVNMISLSPKGKDGNYKYRGEILCRETGQFGYTLRILPKHSLMINPFDYGMIFWA